MRNATAKSDPLYAPAIGERPRAVVPQQSDSVYQWQRQRGARRAPLEVVVAARAQGVGSGNEPPKMSLFPNVAGQTLCGAGFGAAGPPLSAIRQASSAGQSAAFRTSFHTAAP